MLRHLSETEMQRFRRATEAVLETTGFKVEHDGLVRLARKVGARVDGNGGIVRMPASLLRELLGRAPATYVVAGMNGRDLTIGGGVSVPLAIVTDPWIIDFDTRQPRRPCLEDVRRHTIIAQKLDAVGAVSRMDFPVTDVSDSTSSLRALEVHILHHAKHNLVMPASEESWRQWLQIHGILSQAPGPRNGPLFTLGLAVKSPLTLSRENGELLLSACQNGFPVYPTICPMAGSTAPYSLAGTLLLANCENVFMAALTQIVKPGHPVIYAGGPSVCDLRTGHDLYYTLDKVLWKVPLVQLAHSYGLPAHTECGGTLSFRYDPQNGAEGILFMLAACAAKADTMGGLGSCGNAIAMSAEMMVIHTAWLEAARFLLRGVQADDLRLGVESIRQAGPGGNFLTDELTLKLMRSGEFFQNDLFDMSGATHDGPGLLENAHRKVEELVADFHSPVPENVQEGLRRYFHDQYAKSGERAIQ